MEPRGHGRNVFLSRGKCHQLCSPMDSALITKLRVSPLSFVHSWGSLDQSFTTFQSSNDFGETTTDLASTSCPAGITCRRLNHQAQRTRNWRGNRTKEPLCHKHLQHWQQTAQSVTRGKGQQPPKLSACRAWTSEEEEKGPILSRGPFLSWKDGDGSRERLDAGTRRVRSSGKEDATETKKRSSTLHSGL